MWMFRDEYKDQKGAKRKITTRLRRLRRYMLLHYLLLALSLAQSGLSLFVVVNYSGPYQPVLMVFLVLSFAFGLYVLFSGLSN